MTRSTAFKATTLLVLAAIACGGEPDPQADADDQPGAETPAAEAAPEAAERRVEIVAPADGDTLNAGPVTIRLEAHGFQVVPAGDMTANSGHHHLFLDRDVSPAGEPIPTEEGYIIHMGTGASEYTFEAVAPGEHRLIAVVGDAVHIPVDPPLMDTVRFVVR